MSRIIDFNSSPSAKIKKDLEEKNKEIKKLKEELRDAHNKMSNLVSINEMLKLQLTDLLNNLSFFQNHLQSFGHNAKNLKDKLPDLSHINKSSSSVKIEYTDSGKPINFDDKDEDQ